MKVTNWRRRLMASLVAGGLLAPSALHAANLDTNLVIDPGFENVMVGTTCCYMNAATKLNSWTDGTVTGFAYNNTTPELGNPSQLGWDDGGPLAGGGTYFFGAGGTDSTTSPPPITGPGEVAQNISVGTGDTGNQIAIGEAAVVYNAFFTSYNGQNFHGSLHIEFLNSGGGSLGSTVVTAKQARPWHQEGGSSFVPVGTATLRASFYGDGYNAYIDNVDVRITPAVNELLFLEVNTSNGQVAIKNQTGETHHIDYYKVTSNQGNGNSLNAAGWNSLQDPGGNPPGFPSGSGMGDGWEEFGGSDSGVIGESFLTGSSEVVNNLTIGLGAAYNIGGAHDLVFLYRELSASGSLAGDYNLNGTVDAADYVVWRDTDGSAGGYTTWRSNFGATSAAGGPGTFVQGFVRYVTSGAGSGSAVPEPSSVFLAGIGIGVLAIAGRRRTKPDHPETRLA